jgi:hypothetical protein
MKRIKPANLRSPGHDWQHTSMSRTFVDAAMTDFLLLDPLHHVCRRTLPLTCRGGSASEYKLWKQRQSPGQVQRLVRCVFARVTLKPGFVPQLDFIAHRAALLQHGRYLLLPKVRPVCEQSRAIQILAQDRSGNQRKERRDSILPTVAVGNGNDRHPALEPCRRESRGRDCS